MEEQSFLCLLGIWHSRHFLQVILGVADAKENFKEEVNIESDAVSPTLATFWFKDTEFLVEPN